MLLGAVADDLTGATDLALMIAKQGMRTIQVIGVPEPGESFDGADAVVVALKSRSIPADEAVALSADSARALLAAGAEQLVFKYCSTFDSTDGGNIGPVAEALADLVGADMTIACPAFPAAGRTVYQGHLFVGAALLSESPMKDHPLNPMRDSNLLRVLGRQTLSSVGLVALDRVERGQEAIRQALAEQRAAGHRLAIVDAVNDRNLRDIGAACADMKLVTGGSGIAMGLPDTFRARGRLADAAVPMRMAAPPGRAAILAGSCSAATRAQVKAAIDHGMPALRIDPVLLDGGEQDAGSIARWAIDQPADSPVLVYSSADPEQVEAAQRRLGRDGAGAIVEATLARVGGILADNGFTRLLVAGGETSGAVIEALGVVALRIGPEIAPGVPWTHETGRRGLVLALKSGNFGGARFFVEAWDLLDG